MKQIQNKALVSIAALFFIVLTISSCSKKEPTAPMVPKPAIASFAPTSVYPGETVTITGNDFTGVVGVSFGGAAATSFTVTDANTITAVVSTGATGDVKVVTPGGVATLSGFMLMAPMIDGYNNSNEVKASNLIGHWPFDGSTNERVHGASPVLKGGAQTFVSGRIGQAVHLEAGWLTYGPEATSASASNTPYNSNDTLKNGFTLSLWAQVPPTDLLSNLFQLSVSGIPNWPFLGLAYRKHPDNSFDMDFGIGNVDGSGPHISYDAAFMQPAFMDILDWAYLVITYDGADKSMRYYANGILLKTFDLNTFPGGPFRDINAVLTLVAPNYPTIGTFQSKASTPGGSDEVPGYMANGITGNVDDIRFFNATLSETEILALYHLGEAGR